MGGRRFRRQSQTLCVFVALRMRKKHSTKTGANFRSCQVPSAPAGPSIDEVTAGNVAGCGSTKEHGARRQPSGCAMGHSLFSSTGCSIHRQAIVDEKDADKVTQGGGRGSRRATPDADPTRHCRGALSSAIDVPRRVDARGWGAHSRVRRLHRLRPIYQGVCGPTDSPCGERRFPGVWWSQSVPVPRSTRARLCSTVHCSWWERLQS